MTIVTRSSAIYLDRTYVKMKTTSIETRGKLSQTNDRQPQLLDRSIPITEDWRIDVLVRIACSSHVTQ
ncbi:MAG: hypothetical protein J7641_00350 [Cyanobacteria bacterium SID2]|nr:hypothetical protein [Cyanobacteria bacterium SID2]MBP0004133.1 hypothetical protein [Cyanobacteria bacterium SBC]